MIRMQSLSIRAKLIGAFSVFAVAVTGLGLFNLHSVRTIHGLMSEVQGNALPGVRGATDLKTGAGDVRTAVFQHILATDENGLAAVLDWETAVLGSTGYVEDGVGAAGALLQFLNCLGSRQNR